MPSKSNETIKMTNKARYAAVQRLIAKHEADFSTFYNEERVKLGLRPSRTDAAMLGRLHELEERLRELSAQMMSESSHAA